MTNKELVKAKEILREKENKNMNEPYNSKKETIMKKCENTKEN